MVRRGKKRRCGGFSSRKQVSVFVLPLAWIDGACSLPWNRFGCSRLRPLLTETCLEKKKNVWWKNWKMELDWRNGFGKNLFLGRSKCSVVFGYHDLLLFGFVLYVLYKAFKVFEWSFWEKLHELVLNKCQDWRRAMYCIYHFGKVFSRLSFIFITCLTLLINKINMSTFELLFASIIIWFLKQLTGLSVVTMVYVSDSLLCMVAILDSCSFSKEFIF